MATLHPNKYSLDTNSLDDHGHAEKYIIDQINKFDPVKTKNWHIYYSFSFKSTSTSELYKNIKDCEIDFLCLLPNLGIFVFEIKGGFVYQELDDYGEPCYISRGRTGPHIIVNPYEQAKTNKYRLNDNIGPFYLDDKKVELKNFVLDHLVGFADMDKRNIKDRFRTDYNTFFKGDDLYEFLVKAGKKVSVGSPNKIMLTNENIKAVREALEKTNFTYKYNLGNYIDTVNVRVNMLTEEQRSVFTGLLDNNRCLVYGQAGTGKTVISEMLFNYFVINKQKTIYFSYNDFNAKKVEEDLRNNHHDIPSICSPFLRYIHEEYLSVSNNKEIPLDDKGWENYDMMIEYLIEHSNDSKFRRYSTIIIDEAQDIKKNYGNKDESNIVLLLDAMLVGGLKDGMVYIFYDEGQNIFFNHEPFFKNSIFGDARDGYRYAKFRLTKNCRNTENIAAKIADFKENEPLNNLANTNITITNFDDYNTLVNSALMKIRGLINNGVSPSSITILHTANNKKDSAINKMLATIQKDSLDIKEYSLSNAKEHITYTTNRKFKGLENGVIIYLRMEPNYKDRTNKVDYVTVSRAKGLCFIFNLTNC